MGGMRVFFFLFGDTREEKRLGTAVLIPTQSLWTMNCNFLTSVVSVYLKRTLHIFVDKEATIELVFLGPRQSSPSNHCYSPSPPLFGFGFTEKNSIFFNLAIFLYSQT